MEWLQRFWAGNREEILVTALVVLGIQLVTGLGGAIKRRATHMRRVDDGGETK